MSDITEADREAAKSISLELCVWLNSQGMKAEYVNGGDDQLTIAFARHREAVRKARDAEICAWLRTLTPEQMGWQYFGEFDEDARAALADAIERGEV